MPDNLDLNSTVQLWSQIEQRPAYQKLSDQEKFLFKRDYFKDRIASHPQYQAQVRQDPNWVKGFNQQFFAKDFAATQAAADKAQGMEGPHGVWDWATTPTSKTIMKGLNLPTAEDISDEHPIIRGALSTVEGQTSPLSLALWIGTAGLGNGLMALGASARMARAAQTGVGAYFTADMAHGTYKASQMAMQYHDAAKAAEQAGDDAAAKHYYAMRDQTLTEAGISAGLTAMVGKHAWAEGKSAITDTPLPTEKAAMRKAGFRDDFGINTTDAALRYGSPYAPSTAPREEPIRKRARVTSRKAQPQPGDPQYEAIKNQLANIQAKSRGNDAPTAPEPVPSPVAQSTPQTPVEPPKPVATEPVEVLPKQITPAPEAKTPETQTNVLPTQPISQQTTPIAPTMSAEDKLTAAREEVARTAFDRGDVAGVIAKHEADGTFTPELAKKFRDLLLPFNSPKAEGKYTDNGQTIEGRAISPERAKQLENKQKAPSRAQGYLDNYFRAVAAEKELRGRRSRSKEPGKFDQAIANSRTEQDKLFRNWAQFATPEEVNEVLHNMDKESWEKFGKYRELVSAVASDIDVEKLHTELQDRKTTPERKEAIHKLLGHKKTTRFRVFNKTVKNPELLENIKSTQAGIEEQLKTNMTLTPKEREQLENLLYTKEAILDQRGYPTGKYRITGKKNVAAVHTWEDDPDAVGKPTVLDLPTVNKILGTKGKARVGTLDAAEKELLATAKANGDVRRARQVLVRKRLMEKAGALQDEIFRAKGLTDQARTAKGIVENDYAKKLKEVMTSKQTPEQPKPSKIGDLPPGEEPTQTPSTPSPAPKAPPTAEAAKASRSAKTQGKEEVKVLSRDEFFKRAQSMNPKLTDTPEHREVADRKYNQLVKEGRIKPPESTTNAEEVGPGHPEYEALRAKLSQLKELLKEPEEKAPAAPAPLAKRTPLGEASPKLRNELAEVFSQDEFLKGLANKRTSVAVTENNVAPGDNVRIRPIPSDSATRFLAIRTPDGKIQLTYDGSYDTVLHSRTNAGKDITVPEGHTVYVIDKDYKYTHVQVYRSQRAFAPEPQVLAPEPKATAPKPEPPTIKAEPSPGSPEYEALKAKVLAAKSEVAAQKGAEPTPLSATAKVEPVKPVEPVGEVKHVEIGTSGLSENSAPMPNPKRVTDRMRDRALTWARKVGGLDADTLVRKMNFYTADANALIDEWKRGGILDQRGKYIPQPESKEAFVKSATEPKPPTPTETSARRNEAKVKLQNEDAYRMTTNLPQRIPQGALEAINAKIMSQPGPAEFRLRLRDKAIQAYNTLNAKGEDPLALRKVLDRLDALYKKEGMPALRFRSKLEDTVKDAKFPKVGFGKQMLMTLVNKGVSPEEIKWTGLDEFLRDKQKVTKQEIQDYLAQNKVNVEEIQKGTDLLPAHVREARERQAQINVRIEQLDAKMEQLRNTPKGYMFFPAAREVQGQDASVEAIAQTILRYAPGAAPIDVEEFAKAEHEYRQLMAESHRLTLQDTGRNDATFYEAYTMPGGKNYREVLLQLPVKGPIKSKPVSQWGGTEDNPIPTAENAYFGPHWQEPNVLAHVRLKDRVTPDGKKVLFVEEIQSDWHQAGREVGYGDSSERAELSKAFEEASLREIETAKAMRAWLYNALPERTRMALEEKYGTTLTPDSEVGIDLFSIRNMADELSRSNSHVITESKFHLLRSALQNAATVRGEAQHRLTRANSAPPDAPFKANWHELALRRILQMAAEGGYDKVAWAPGWEHQRRYGAGIQGEAHGYLYDKMIPNYLNKFGKKFGASVDSTVVDVPDTPGSGGLLTANGEPTISNLGGKTEVPSIDITPEMRSAASVNEPYLWGAPKSDKVWPVISGLPATLARVVRAMPVPLQKALTMSPARAVKLVAGHVDPILRRAMLDMGVNLHAGTYHTMELGYLGKYFHELDDSPEMLGLTNHIQVRAQGTIERWLGSHIGDLTMNEVAAHELGHHIWDNFFSHNAPSFKEIVGLFPDATHDIYQRYKTFPRGMHQAASEVFANAFKDFYLGGKGNYAGMREILSRLPEDLRDHALSLERAGESYVPDGIPYRLNDLSYRASFGMPFAGLPVSHPVSKLLQAFKQTPEGIKAEAIVREKTGDLRREKAQLYEQLDKWIKKFDSMDRVGFERFMDAVDAKPGAAPLGPEDQLIARHIQDMIAERRDYIHALNPRMFEHFLENYWPHVFEGKTGFDAIRQILGTKRQLAGPQGFKKSRYYDYTTDAMAAGAKPVTYNPIRMALLRMHEMDRYIMAHEIKRELRSTNLIQFIKRSVGRPSDPTWQVIDDPLFVGHTSAGVDTGRYWAPPEVARVLNNYLSPGLRGNPVFDIARSYGNMLNQAQLGMSAFHLTFEAINSMMCDFALGMQKLFTRPGQRLDGLALMGRSFVPFYSGYHAYKLGSMIREEYLNPGTHPRLAAYTDSLTRAGGAINQDPFYRNAGIQHFKRAWQDRTLGTSPLIAWRGVKALIEAASYPIMDHIVPRMKAGVFAQMAESELADMHRQGITDHYEVSARLDKVWNSVDNRMGQLVYDNLFWNKSAKDLAMLGVRSVGWNMGTVREIGGGLRDIGKLRKGELTSRLAYTFAMPIVAGTIGAVANVLMTGQSPQDLHDYFFPRTGQVDTGGKPSRISFPSYMKDVYGLAHEPSKTIVNKAHPMFQQMYDLYNNKDYYNVEIAHPGDPVWKRAEQRAAYWFGSYKPLFVANYSQRASEGGAGLQTGLQSFVGLNPAPKWIGQTNAEQLAYDLAVKDMAAGPRTTDSFNHQRLFDRVRAEYANKKISWADVQALEKSGKLKPSDLDTLVEETRMSPLERHFSRLRIEDALAVWDRATPDERALLRPMLDDKGDQIYNLTSDKRDEVAKHWQNAIHSR